MKQVNPKADEQTLIINYYKEIALPHLVDFPVEISNPISFTLPEGTESWDVSDPVEDIDWIESAIVSPNIFPGYSTVKRTYGPDQEPSQIKKPLDVYIGIDCSGSMNNPSVVFSWPVLAATIIGLSALRAGAKVMGCLSGEPGSFMETNGFLTSDNEVLKVLTSYLGTGYSYGIPRLEKPFGKRRDKKSHIILVTDDDIFSMLDAEKPEGEESNWQVIEKALKNAGGVGTLVLHSNRDWRKEEVNRLAGMGWCIYYVTNEQQLLDFAARFAKDHYHYKNSRMQVFDLINHLKNCPESFLLRSSDAPGEKLPAEVLTGDLYRFVYGNFNISGAELPSLAMFPDTGENHIFAIQLACWLFSYPDFKNQPSLLLGIHQFLFEDLKTLSPFVKYRDWVDDDDRAEEFIRIALKRCSILPEGETAETASDKLEALDTLKRMNVIRESNDALERIKEIRRQMAEKKAREAANVYGRE